MGRFSDGGGFNNGPQAGAAALIPNADIWKTSGMIIPAIMTLICFICTAVSLTVSGFICLRDREAQDETDNKAKHHKQQEFISKVLGLFYKIRTSNVFRIQEIMQDLNDERPVWIGSRADILVNMEYYGLALPDSDKSKLNASSEVYEIDCEALFYFELERFSKAQAVYGSNVTKYFECIQQDGSSFPREFYPDSKSIYHIDVIYNVYTEMQTLTELFVLLSTGIDLEIINIYSIPPQFKHSNLGEELGRIKDFLYNYYKRVFPKERSFANVMRKLPQLPIVYEPIFELISAPTEGGKSGGKSARRPSVVSLDAIGEDELVESAEEVSPELSPVQARAMSPLQEMELELSSPVREVAYDIEIPEYTRIPELSALSEIPVPQEYYDAGIMGTPSGPGYSSDPWSGKTAKTGYFQSKGKRITAQLSKRRMKIVSVYKTLAQRLKQRSRTAGEQVMEETTSYIEEMGIPPQNMGRPGPSGMHTHPSGMHTHRRDASPPTRFQQVYDEEPSAAAGMGSPKVQSPKAEPSPKVTSGKSSRRSAHFEKEKRREEKKERKERERSKDRKTQEQRECKKHPVISEKLRREQILEAMRRRYRAPIRADSNPRRRGRLARMLKLDHNAFTYMVTRVLAFLQDRGRISEDELQAERFRCVDRNFVI